MFSATIHILTSLALVAPTDVSALSSRIAELEGSIAALERSLKSLDDPSPNWETIAWVSSIVVAMGVALELVDLGLEYQDEKRRLLRSELLPDFRPSKSRFLFAGVATMLVIAGVVGEAIASVNLASLNSRLRSTSTELRAQSDQLLSLTTLLAGSAQQSAISAASSAGGAKSTADKAEKDALEETKARMRVEAEIAWRGLSSAQVSDIRSKLAKYAKQKAVVLSNDRDQEGYDFAAQLTVALFFARWDAVTPMHIPESQFVGSEETPDAPAKPPITGVTISCGAGLKSLQAAKSLLSELRKLGFSSDFGYQQRDWPPTVIVKVETRPSGPQGATNSRPRAAKDDGVRGAPRQ